MQKKDFSIKESLHWGFWAFFEHIDFFLKIVGIEIIGVLLLGLLVGIILFPFTQQMQAVITGHLVLIGMCFSAKLYYMMFKGILDIYDKERACIKELWHALRASQVFRVWIVHILVSLLTSFGYLFLIIPGIFLDIVYGFSMYVCLDQNTGIMQSLRMSSVLSRGVRLKLFGFYTLLYIINIIAGLTVIGFLITLPVSLMARIYVYRELLELQGPIKA